MDAGDEGLEGLALGLGDEGLLGGGDGRVGGHFLFVVSAVGVWVESVRRACASRLEISIWLVFLSSEAQGGFVRAVSGRAVGSRGAGSAARRFCRYLLQDIFCMSSVARARALPLSQGAL